MNNSRINQRGWVLGVFLIIIAITLLGIAIQAGPPPTGSLNKEYKWRMLFGGFYVQYLGLLLLLSYFFEQKCFLFRAIIWFTEGMAFPFRGKGNAMFGAIMFFIGGTATVVIALMMIFC